MSGEGAPEFEVPDASELTVAIVAGSWHVQVMDGLIAGATATLEKSGASFDLIRVPGAFELPVVAAKCVQRYDAVVALGVIIRGGTPHFDYVCNAATDGLTRVALDSGRPVGFGLLTCDTEQQALDRAGLPDSVESKGEEAALAALQTAIVLRAI
ncbi:MAG: 6,7-dimethyl-8-ribityllumazine synthase [Candidatus Nanopelagicales bacterium]